MTEQPDLRSTEPGICGVTHILGSTEWICVRPVHAKTYERRSTNIHHHGTVYDNSPQVDRHYFVNRYPYRNRKEQE